MGPTGSALLEMGWLEAGLVALVRGLAEVLPISSSGHLVVAESLLGSRGEGILFGIAVRTGSLLAILLFFRRRVADLVRGVLALRPDAIRYAGKLVVATLPALVGALTLRELVESLCRAPWVVGAALLATGALLMTTRRTVETASDPEPGWVQALAIGCAQVLALVPGISRSGVTVAVALALGVAALPAAEFSFLLAVAAVPLATGLALPEPVAAASAEIRSLLFGGTVALAAGLVALWLFVRLLRARRFHRFAYYVGPVGAAVLAGALLAGG